MVFDLPRRNRGRRRLDRFNLSLAESWSVVAVGRRIFPPLWRFEVEELRSRLIRYLRRTPIESTTSHATEIAQRVGLLTNGCSVECWPSTAEQGAKAGSVRLSQTAVGRRPRILRFGGYLELRSRRIRDYFGEVQSVHQAAAREIGTSLAFGLQQPSTDFCLFQLC